MEELDKNEEFRENQYISMYFFMEQMQKAGIPLNKEELKLCKEILEHQKIFDEKFEEIKKGIGWVFSQYDPNGGFIGLESSVCNMIKHVFCLELQDKPFAFTQGITHHLSKNWMVNRITPCEICGENRTFERCHIIPARKDGALTPENMFFLCPTHHKLFDASRLTKDEIAKLNWLPKSQYARAYYTSELFINNMVFLKEYTTVNDIINSGQPLSFEEFIFFELRNRLKNKGYINQKEILKTFCASSVRYVRDCIKKLQKECIITTKKEKSDLYLSFDKDETEFFTKTHDYMKQIRMKIFEEARV
jgi:hypothetical protein